MEKLDLDKYFLNKEHSLKLQKMDFNEPCIFYFVSSDQNFGNITHSNSEGAYVKTGRDNIGIPRPSYDQAFNWFLEERRLSGNVKHNTSGTYSFKIQKHLGDATGWHQISGFVEKNFYTKIETKQYLIEKLIEIVENEKV